MAGHHGHHHIRADADQRRLWIALALIVGFMAVEVVVGILASSLALLSDAAHMLTDAAAIALSLFAARLAARPVGGIMTYGMGRAEIMSALVNAVSLLVLAAIIAVEAVRRLTDPPAVDAAPVLAVAVLGMLVNIAAARVLAGAERRSLNVEGSLQHILTDLYASIAAATAAGTILLTGYQRADALASLVVVGLMLRSGVQLLRDSGRVVMEAAPRGLNPDLIGGTLAAQKGVVEVHDLHVWEVTSGFAALSAHVLVRAGADCHATRRDLEALLAQRFDLHHTTLQVEHEHDQRLLSIEPSADAGGESSQR